MRVHYCFIFSTNREFVLAVVICHKTNIMKKNQDFTKVSETSKWSKNCEKLRKKNQNKRDIGQDTEQHLMKTNFI